MYVGRASLAAAALVVTVCAGCSNREAAVNKRAHNGTGTASPVAGIQTITVTSGVDLRFHPSTLVVHSGRVRIVLQNTSKAGAGPPHNLEVTGLPGVFVPTTAAGQTQSMTFTAPAPGTYDFVCTIHANQGQTGKLVVE
jgi:plastocyanin